MGPVEQKVLEHRPCNSFELNGQYCTPCSCGKQFSGKSPSTAYGLWSRHSKKESPKATTPPVVPIARIRVCGCGCGESLAPRAGGLFRSGHDARFKSVLTVAHAADQQVRHPATGELSDPMGIAVWLDERRGGGAFWQNKVQAGHKPVPERQPRPAREDRMDAAARAVLRVDALMESMATRRPAAGDIGKVTMRSGQVYGARVLRRASSDSLALILLDGPTRGQDVVVSDHRFAKPGKI